MPPRSTGFHHIETGRGSAERYDRTLAGRADSRRVGYHARHYAPRPTSMPPAAARGTHRNACLKSSCRSGVSVAKSAGKARRPMQASTTSATAGASDAATADASGPLR